MRDPPGCDADGATTTAGGAQTAQRCRSLTEQRTERRAVRGRIPEGLPAGGSRRGQPRSGMPPLGCFVSNIYKRSPDVPVAASVRANACLERRHACRRPISSDFEPLDFRCSVLSIDFRDAVLYCCAGSKSTVGAACGSAAPSTRSGSPPVDKKKRPAAREIAARARSDPRGTLTDSIAVSANCKLASHVHKCNKSQVT